ncbi:MAG: hypothetical protein AAF512_08170 [Pseudomonadota bacterium]
MSGKFRTTWFYAPLGTYEEAGLLRKKTYYTERRVDFDSYADALRQKYEEMDSGGYEVINVVPITMGQSESFSSESNTAFSITRGAVVVGKKRDI